jgi:hypothetical protein
MFTVTSEVCTQRKGTGQAHAARLAPSAVASVVGLEAARSHKGIIEFTKSE